MSTNEKAPERLAARGGGEGRTQFITMTVDPSSAPRLHPRTFDALEVLSRVHPNALDRAEYDVLVQLARHQNGTTGEAWPSQTEIAASARLTSRTVGTVLGNLSGGYKVPKAASSNTTERKRPHVRCRKPDNALITYVGLSPKGTVRWRIEWDRIRALPQREQRHRQAKRDDGAGTPPPEAISGPTPPRTPEVVSGAPPSPPATVSGPTPPPPEAISGPANPPTCNSFGSHLKPFQVPPEAISDKPLIELVTVGAAPKRPPSPPKKSAPTVGARISHGTGGRVGADSGKYPSIDRAAQRELLAAYRALPADCPLILRMTTLGVDPNSATDALKRYRLDRIRRVLDHVAAKIAEGDCHRPGGRIMVLLRKRSTDAERTPDGLAQHKLEQLRRTKMVVAA